MSDVMFFTRGDSHGTLDPMSIAAERAILPVVGPTGFVLGRKLVRLMTHVEEGTTLPIETQSIVDCMGLVSRTKAEKTLERMERHHLVVRNLADDSWTVAMAWPAYYTHPKAGADLQVAVPS